MKTDLRGGVSRIATSWMLAPAAIVAAGMSITSPARAQLLCTSGAGINLLCAANPGAPAPAAPVSVVGPRVVTLVGEVDSATGIDLTTIGTGADLVLTPTATAVLNTVDEPALALTSGGGIDARVTSLATSGDGAAGVLLRAVDDVLFTVDDRVSTVGDRAPGIDARGGAVTVDAGTIVTTGDDAGGAQLLAVNGPAVLDADLIDTSGNFSTAALVTAAGDVTVDVGVLRTRGGQALGLNVATDPAACVLLGNGGCSVTAAADQITTNGFGGIGALITAAAPVAVNIGALETNGDQAAGLSLAADPTLCATLGAGACDANFTVGNLVTNDVSSPGALIRAAGNVTGSVNVLRTNGANAFGLDIASDPDACVLLGAGACGASFNIGQLTTSGAGATGVLARVAGPTMGRIGLLETAGDDADGIDIAADPDACILLGSGACDIDLAANQVTTTGNGALGVLITAPANVLASFGTIDTRGDNATGLRIVTDPAVCLVLGPGSCAVDATTGPINTGGDGSDGVDVDGGDDPVTVETGDVTTGGDDADGVDVEGTGPVTVTTGDVATGGDGSTGVIVDGGAGPITVTTGTVTTGGDNAPGIDVSGTGPIGVTTGTVTTGGDGSTGVIVGGGDGDIAITFGDIVTTGDDARGVDATGNGAITVAGSSVTTTGAGSDGIALAGGAGPVGVTVGQVTTTGADADGITITTTSGEQDVTVGRVIVSGPNADAISATSAGCSAVSITATGPVSAAQGTGILAASACSVAVTTQAAASVNGQTAGIGVTSGTGSAITVGAGVDATAGPAINADGAMATLAIVAGGQVNGYVDLTDANDSVVNDGTFAAVGDSRFGGGTDTFVNNRLFAVRPAGGVAGAVTLGGLESFTNTGLIDLRNGVVGDTLTLPGSFTGGTGSTLGIDVAVGPAGSAADRLVIGGAATGRTAILLRSLQPNRGVLVNNLVVVDAGAGSSPDAFSITGGAFVDGLVGYRLVFDPSAATYGLYGTPSGQALELVKLGSGAREIFYRGNDAVAGHLQTDRDASAASDETPRRGSALWGQVYGSANRDRRGQDFTAFGQPITAPLSHKQDYYGGQFGLDLGGFGRPGVVFGVTGGYANSTLGFTANADRFGYQGVNGGVYAGLKAGAFFLNALAKYEHYWIDLRMPTIAIRQTIDGNGYGGMAQAGVRFGGARFFAEPSVAVDYARSSIDGLTADTTRLDFADTDGLRGRAGLRIGSTMTSGATISNVYLKGEAIHEFEGRDRLGFANGGFDLAFANRRLGTYGRGTVGVTVTSGTRVSGFLEAFGDVGDDYRGGGGRAGLSVRF